MMAVAEWESGRQTLEVALRLSALSPNAWKPVRPPEALSAPRIIRLSV